MEKCDFTGKHELFEGICSVIDRRRFCGNSEVLFCLRRRRSYKPGMLIAGGIAFLAVSLLDLAIAAAALTLF